MNKFSSFQFLNIFHLSFIGKIYFRVILEATWYLCYGNYVCAECSSFLCSYFPVVDIRTHVFLLPNARNLISLRVLSAYMEMFMPVWSLKTEVKLKPLWVSPSEDQSHVNTHNKVIVNRSKILPRSEVSNQFGFT